jgi:hypothetical protein
VLKGVVARGHLDESIDTVAVDAQILVPGPILTGTKAGAEGILCRKGKEREGAPEAEQQRAKEEPSG